MKSFYLDLKAFERRLTEYIHCLQPATGRWRSKCLDIFLRENKLTSGADWITLSETSGAAGELVELTVSVSANGYDSRSGVILLANGAATAQVTVEQSQENALRLVGETSTVIDSAGGSFTIEIESNLSVTVNPGVEWITLA